MLSRGNERKDIFCDDQDRLTFLDAIGQMAENYDADIFAYVLMSNHYHILLRTNQANLSNSMQWLALTYTLSPIVYKGPSRNGFFWPGVSFSLF